jgi:hypothetical protein
MASLRKFDGRHNDLVNRYEISVPLVVSTSRSCPHSWLIPEFVTGATWWVPLVLPGHLTSPRIFVRWPGRLREEHQPHWKSRGEVRCSGRLREEHEPHWKIRGEVRCPGSTSGTHHVAPVTNSGISHEWGHDREVLTTSGTGSSNFTPAFSVGFVFLS